MKPYVSVVADGGDFYIPGALHIERRDDVGLAEDDTAAAKMAQMDGVALICGMPHVADGVYVDTEENRQLILDMLDKYPEFNDSGCGK